MSDKCYFCEHERGPLAEQSEACDTCRDFNNFQVKKRMSSGQFYEYEKLKYAEEQFANQNEVFDIDTASMVLKDITAHMCLSTDRFGNKTLVINRYTFELIRKKYLDKKDDKK